MGKLYFEKPRQAKVFEKPVSTILNLPSNNCSCVHKWGHTLATQTQNHVIFS